MIGENRSIRFIRIYRNPVKGMDFLMDDQTTAPALYRFSRMRQQYVSCRLRENDPATHEGVMGCSRPGASGRLGGGPMRMRWTFILVPHGNTVHRCL